VSLSQTKRPCILVETLAHIGHWATGIAAALPLVLCLAAVAVVIVRDRLGLSADPEGGPRGGEGVSEPGVGDIGQHVVEHRVT
jgi:hypothetical protein